MDSQKCNFDRFESYVFLTNKTACHKVTNLADYPKRASLEILENHRHLQGFYSLGGMH